MSIHIRDDGSIRAKGIHAQELLDAVAGPAAVPSLSPGHIRRQLRIMDETILSIRDAAKFSRIQCSKPDRELLADDVRAHALRVLQLETEIREAR